jgi:hypothetical protein
MFVCGIYLIDSISLRQRDESYSTETQRLGQMLQKVQTELLSTNAEKRRMEQDRNAFEMSWFFG